MYTYVNVYLSVYAYMKKEEKKKMVCREEKREEWKKEERKKKKKKRSRFRVRIMITRREDKPILLTFFITKDML